MLKSCQEPELLLYTWNNDPRTYAVDKPEVRMHRLGIYDWIHRSHMATMFAFFSVLFNYPLIMNAGHQGEPSEETFLPQIFIAISCIMGQIAEYPFTQLEVNDPVEIAKSGENPDSRLGGGGGGFVGPGALQVGAQADPPWGGGGGVCAAASIPALRTCSSSFTPPRFPRPTHPPPPSRRQTVSCGGGGVGYQRA